jgi:hypothetical protein
MDRVKEAGFAFGAKWYQAWWQNPWSRGVAERRNLGWIRAKIRAGFEVVDIGIDRSRPNRSPFYKMERRELARAKHAIVKVFWP